MKRQIDLNEVVIGYRQAGVRFTDCLANLGEEFVSSQIFIDTGLPLAPHKPHHKKGALTHKGEDVSWLSVKGIIVYLYYNETYVKFAKFGDVVYHSFGMRYVHLYVRWGTRSDILKELR